MCSLVAGLQVCAEPRDTNTRVPFNANTHTFSLDHAVKATGISAGRKCRVAGGSSNPCSNFKFGHALTSAHAHAHQQNNCIIY